MEPQQKLQLFVGRERRSRLSSAEDVRAEVPQGDTWPGVRGVWAQWAREGQPGPASPLQQPEPGYQTVVRLSASLGIFRVSSF